MTTPEQRFAIVNEYLGSGDPGENGSSVWFIGIEEAAGWKSQDEVERVRDKWYGSEGGKVKKDRGKVYPWIANIVCASMETAPSDDWRNNLFRKGSKVFVANLFPLGKRNTAVWDETYKELFGYGSQDLTKYKAKVQTTRFPYLLTRWNECRPKATVCFGTSCLEDFQDHLFQDKLNFESCEFYMKCNEKKRILITQHPSSRHWNNDKKGPEKLLVIQQQLVKWGVTLPWCQ